MPVLVLLNGVPAAGKSTVAARLVATSPLALNLDIDVVRHQLGGWLDQPDRAGAAARNLAEAMARTHLNAGHHVVVPQFLARPGFIERLEALASDVGVAFVELVLDLSRDDAIAALDRRHAAPEHRTHVDGASLMASSGETAAMMYDRLQGLLAERPGVIRVPARRGDVDATVRAVTAAIASNRAAW